MNDTIEAIRSKFAPRPPAPSANRHIRDEAYSLSRPRLRRVQFSDRPARELTDEARDLRDREREARQAFSDATGAETAALAAVLRARDDNGLLGKLTDPGAVDRTRRHYERCVNARLLAESELDEILLERAAYRRRQRARHLAEAHASIAERDRVRAIRRRAAGLLPLERGERIPITAEVARRFGAVVVS